MQLIAHRRAHGFVELVEILAHRPTQGVAFRPDLQSGDQVGRGFERRPDIFSEAALERIIRLSYDLLGLISFFTTVSDELKAWTVQRGTDAVHAAGKIHSDIERGFIKAEVIGYDDLMRCGSTAEGKKHGLLRAEGKGYTVQDGDVITFLFNV